MKKIFICALAAAITGCGEVGGISFAHSDDGPLVRALRDQSLPQRWAFRMSTPTRAEGCGQADSLPRLRCHGDSSSVPLSAGINDVARRAAEAVRGSIDPDALHAAALVDLISGDTAGKALRRSISYLEMTTRLQPASASALSDLAAAQLAYSASGGGAKALLGSIEAASRAREIDSLAPAPMYDRALALDLLALDVEAAKAWREYLSIDSRTTYADVARGRIAILATMLPAHDTAGIQQQGAGSHATSTAPDRTRTAAWEQLLRDWGEATLSGDSARARKQLAMARHVGARLARQYGESSTADAVLAIEHARSRRSATRRLAQAHVLYALAQAHAHVNAYRSADSAFQSVLALRPPSASLTAWVSARPYQCARLSAPAGRGRVRDAQTACGD